MNGENTLDPRKLTFSQAYGYEDLPQPLKLGELSREARTKLWSLLYLFVTHESGMEWGKHTSLGNTWGTIFQFLHVNFFVLPVNEFNSNIGTFVDSYQRKFMNNPSNDVFDLLLVVMRHSHCPPEFTRSVGGIFEECRLAYVLDVDSPPTIYPAATPEEGRAILRSATELSNVGLAGAVRHLQQASGCISQGDYPGAVRESIHAVESTARHFDSDAGTLGPALKSLERAGALHPALKQAFSNLYGYTSDEQGIRHALIDGPQANVGHDEAVFMLGACASFSSYLARKHQRQVS